MKNEIGQVELKVGTGADQKVFKKDYTKVEFELSDLQELFSGPNSAKALADLNYGWDLKARAKVRAELEKTTAGPEKSFDKLVKTLIDNFASMGMTITREQAEKQAKDMQAAAKAQIESSKVTETE